MNINLREDKTNNYVSFFGNYLEDIQRLNLKVTDVLNEIMEQSKYDKLQNLISNIIDAYTVTIVNNIETGVFPTWKESEGSLRACLRTYRAGDAADEVCAQIEQHMNDLMIDTLKIEKGELIITERPIVSEDGLERLEDICRNAQSDIVDLKSQYVSEIEVKTHENDIYGTLMPLIEGVSANIESFFEASLNSFTQLHEFVQGISLQLHNIVEENDVVSSSGKAVNKELVGNIAGLAQNMADTSRSKSLEDLKKITQFLYDTINAEAGSKKKKLNYELISQITSVYHKFYEQFGNILKDRFSTPEEREEFVKREFIQVTRERNNDQYFEGDEVWTFKSHAHHTYIVFDRVADMLKNIAKSCETSQANDINLLYGAYVLFTPILEGMIDAEDFKEYSKFSSWASAEILRILEMENLAVEEDDEDKDSQIVFTGENFTDENIKLFVVVVEKIVNQVGAEDLNKSVNKHYASLTNSRKGYSKRAKAGTSKQHNVAENTYGRYMVTKKSIQLMAPVCEQANDILEPIDKFYKEKFESLGAGFDKANTTIHALSSFIGLWGLGTWNLSKMFSTEDSDKSIMEKIQLGGIALSSCTTAGKVIMGGAHMVKILDWAMPYMKKSKMIVKISEKVWNLTRQDIQIPYFQRMMDQYVMEHHEIKYGMLKGQSGMFVYYHNVATKIEDNHQRRAFENAVFSADTVIPQHYTVTESNPKKNREICLGVFLNLVRSGMCSKQEIESGTSNEIVDKLYDTYVSAENIKPRVDINPDKRLIK